MKTPRGLLVFALVLVTVLSGGLATASARDGYYRHSRHYPARVVVRPIPPVYGYGYYHHPRYYHRAYAYPPRPFYYGPRYHHDYRHGWRR
ncbi:MAG: hypothetical protein ACFUZC_01455 [Chthoniobacteraceae bacterium]